MKARYLRRAFLSFLVCSALASSASPPPGELTLGVIGADEQFEGQGDLLIPVWGAPRGLVFVNPRASRNDHGEEEYSLGGGFRYLWPDRKVILGANAYYDRRDTRDADYDQWGVGFECLSARFDLRANFYWPEDDRVVVGQHQTMEIERSRVVRQEWTDPWAAGHQIQQSLVTQERERITKTTRLYEQHERPMEGWDAEIGVRWPLKKWEPRFYLGYERFESEYGEDVAGVRARAEVHWGNAFVLDALWREDASVRSGEYAVGARVRLPLDLAALARGRNPFAGAGERWRGELPPFDARLVEMVMRDRQVRLERSAWLERVDARRIESHTRRKTRSQTFTVLDDVNFVDADNAAGLADGTAERPYPTIQEGVDNAFGQRNVFVSDAAAAYEENVVLTPGITLWGSGCPVPARGGRSFGSGRPPVIDGRGAGPAILLGQNTIVRGFEIRNSTAGSPVIQDLPVLGPTDVSRVGILGVNVGSAVVECNRIGPSEVGLLLTSSGDLNARVRRNTLSGSVSGIRIAGVGQSGTFDALLSGNTYERNGLGLGVQANSYQTATLRLDGERFIGQGAQGASLLVRDSVLANVQISNAEAAENGGCGFEIRVEGCETAVLNITRTRALNNAQDGIAAHVFARSNAWVALGVDPALDGGFVDVAGNRGCGARLSAQSSNTAVVLVGALRADSNRDEGALLDVQGLRLAAALFGDAVASRNDGAGLRVNCLSTAGDAMLVATRAAPEGLPLLQRSFGATGAAGLVALENAGAGLDAEVSAATLALVQIGRARFANNGGAGGALRLRAPTGFAVAALTDALALPWTTPDEGPLVPSSYLLPGQVVAEGNAGPGITLDLQSWSEARVYALGVRALRNGGDGFSVSLQTGEGNAALAAAHMESSYNGGCGLAFDLDVNLVSQLLVSDAQVLRNSADGFRAQVVSRNENASMFVSGLSAENNGARGVASELAALNLTAASFSGLSARSNAQAGVSVSLSGESAALWMGPTAPARFLDQVPLRAQYVEELIRAARNGPIVCSQNGGAGLEVAITVLDDIEFDARQLAARENGEAGMTVALGSVDGAVDATLSNSDFSGNAEAGLSFLVAGLRPTTRALWTGVSASDNRGSGFEVYVDSWGLSEFLGEALRAARNGQDGIYVRVLPLGPTVFDLGGGSLGSSGNSLIENNGRFALFNDGELTIEARNNWWGSANPDPGIFQGRVNYIPFLLAPPP